MKIILNKLLLEPTRWQTMNLHHAAAVAAKLTEDVIIMREKTNPETGLHLKGTGSKLGTFI